MKGMAAMDILAQCRMWHHGDEYQKIIDALEKIGPERRTMEMDLELARAYNNQATAADKDLLWKAAALLRKHEEKMAEDYSWNFRLAYAYYYLDREDQALGYFRKALTLHPGDRPNINTKAEIEEFIKHCMEQLVCPDFSRPFRRRVLDAWAAFAAEEAEFRALIDRKSAEAGEELVARVETILRRAVHDMTFELGKHDDRYELILSADGQRMNLFQLSYFAKYAPLSVRAHWDIYTGRQRTPGFVMRSGSWEVAAEDVDVWAEPTKSCRAKVTLYAKTLKLLMAVDHPMAEWMLSVLVDTELGEVAAMSALDGLDVAGSPLPGMPISLRWLYKHLEELGADMSGDAERSLAWTLDYTLEADTDENASWRLDVCEGETRAAPLINEYLKGESWETDRYFADGITAGFFIIPAASFDGDRKSMAAFLGDMGGRIQKEAGPHAVTLLGTAAGLYAGYIDFIAWDTDAVFRAADICFTKTDLPWAGYHSFRRDLPTMRLINREGVSAPQIHENSGSVLSREELDRLYGYAGEKDGLFYQMVADLEALVKKSIEEGRFTEDQAWADAEVSSLYGYACNNVDEYEYYAKAAHRMAYAERSDGRTGKWYDRYSVALMHTGRLAEAKVYAEQGIAEDPSYPWTYLQVGKLRAHFGDTEGALEAARQGLVLVPGDYEFQTLEKEIREGASLETMCFHWCDPENDRMLHEGPDEDGMEKMRVNRCLIPDPEGLAAVKNLFAPVDWTPDHPYCHFHAFVQGRAITVVFHMNEAGVSKLPLDFLIQVKSDLDSGKWIDGASKKGTPGLLESVVIDLNETVSLFYKGKHGEEGFILEEKIDKRGEP